MDNKENVYDASIDAKFESRSFVEVLRDSSSNITVNGESIPKISGYKFKILVHNAPAIEGEFTREEVELLFRLYSSEGSNLTQRSVSRYFPNYTFQEFKKIIKAFNLTKSSSPLAPHLIEEKDPESLVALVFHNKENDFLKRLEQEKLKFTEDKLAEITRKYWELKNRVDSFSEFSSGIRINPELTYLSPVVQTDKHIIVYLSDMHIGAKVSSNSIYNNDFNYVVAKERLNNILIRTLELARLTGVTNIIVCNIGDSLDGYNEQTTRGGHSLPQNMNNREQFTNYTQLMVDFFASIRSSGLFDTVKYYCVECGNHDGDFGWMANKFLETYLTGFNIETKIFTKFIDHFICGNHTFILCHGKDAKDMFKNLPLTINDKTENQISEYINYNNIQGNIHFVKGDLHQSATTYGKRFRYKSVGSFFGSSEWIHKNFGNTKAVCDIDIVDKDTILETRLILN